MKLPSPSKALAIGAGVVIVALTGAAFWLSYAHLAEVALGHGLRQVPARAWAWPATLDLFIVAGELLMLRAALAKRVDPWAIGLTTVGSLGSIVLNVAGVTGTRDPGMVPVLDYVVAAVPPTAALLAFGALMRQIHQALAERDEVWSKTTPAAPEVPAEPAAVEAEPVSLDKVPAPVAEPLPTVPALPVLGPWTPVAELLAVPAGTSRDLQGSGRPEPLQADGEEAEEHPEPPPVPPVPPTADDEPDEVELTAFDRQVADARNWLATEPELTGTAIGQRLGTSDAYGRRIRRAALELPAATAGGPRVR
ncbi:DUF2637 domain-containing protein [Streptomyces sp. NPDC088915]|uniref:DUF2637 domain-containing protein n=1 Tax=Streptomyces sp. NPDC088915 TaxID=3365912 RepID=UPI003820981F